LSLNLQDAATWSSFRTASECERQLPPQVDQKLTAAQKLIVVKALRPDRLYSAMKMFAETLLGLAELSPPALDLKQVAAEAGASECILILTTPGADPTGELRELARSTIGLERLHEVPMGQGQQTLAIGQLRECARSGDWLCLYNLHLVIAWLPELVKELNVLQGAGASVHDNFRLWLTAEEHTKFPPVLLQSSLKLTFESPPGIKRNMLRTINAWGVPMVEKETSSVRARTLFALAWMHGVCQERRIYIPQSWVKFYEFNYADIKAAYHVIDAMFARVKNKGFQKIPEKKSITFIFRRPSGVVERKRTHGVGDLRWPHRQRL
jgi:dynein heavy chain 2